MAIGDKRIDVWVQKYAPANLARLLDAKVRYRACGRISMTREARLSALFFYVPDFRQIVIEDPGLADPFQVGVTPINRLFNIPATEGREPRRVRIHGTVVQQVPGVFAIITDETERIRCFSPQTIRLEPDQRVDVIGFPVLRKGERIVEDATFRLVGRSPTSLLQAPRRLFWPIAAGDRHC